MGRHADTTRHRGFRVPIGVISIVVVVLCAVGLGVWWWSLKSATDPIDADPVDAYAIVVASPTCSAGGETTVRVSGTTPPVTATLGACGYRVGEQLPVQYLAGHPDTVRLAGTSTAGAQSMAAKLLPIGILAAGVIAVLATIALLIDRRRSRHQANPIRRGRRGSEAIAEQPAAGAGGAAIAVAPYAPGPAEVATGGDDRAMEDSAAGDSFGSPTAAADPSGSPAAAADPPGSPADAGADASGPVMAGPVEVAWLPLPEPQPAGLFPEEAFGSGYALPPPIRTPPVTDDATAAAPSMVIDDGILFTHTNPEPPEPADAPVELSGDGPQHLPQSVTLPSHDQD